MTSIVSEWNWKDIFQAAATVVALIGLFFAIYQYRLAQRWQKSRFAAELTEKFHSDEDLILAWRFLDWHDRQIVLPSKFSEDGKNPQKFFYSIEKLAGAMSMQNREKSPNTGLLDLRDGYRTHEYLVYVEIFDRFFDYITQIYGYLRNRLVDEEDLTTVFYILHRLDNFTFQQKKIFQGYLQAYDYRDVLRMIEMARASGDFNYLETAGKNG